MADKVSTGAQRSRGVYVDDIQVVGAQQNSIANTDNAVDNLEAAVNEILVALRAHGLIASA